MDLSTYHHPQGRVVHTNAYLLPRLHRILSGFEASCAERRLFDLGCGNGSVAQDLAAHGWNVTGVDPSRTGIEIARATAPGVRFDQGTCYEDLAARFGRFPVVISLEVVEHVYAPREFARCAFDLVEPGGWLIVSTPYHGYLKNLALALTGRMEAHFTALRDHGHIKFWSIATLTVLLRWAGFDEPTFHRVGRIAPLAKSMVAVARRPR